MDQVEAVRRLRTGGMLAIATIALMVIVQAGVIEYRFATAPVQTDLVNRSSLRRASTMAVLYQAERAASTPSAVAGLDAAITALDEQNNDLGDLKNADRQLFEQFEAAARHVAGDPHNAAMRRQLGTLGMQMYAAFDRATLENVRRGNGQRSTSRNIVLVAGGVILVVVALLYAFVMRRREVTIESALKALEERRQRFAAMFDNASEMMCIYDVEGKIVRGNRAALIRLGFGIDAVGQKYDVHVAPASRAQTAVEFAAAAAGKAVEFTSVFIEASGKDVPVVGSLAPIVVNGRVEGVVGSARDVTVERRFEAELLRSNERFRSLFASSPNAILAVDAEGVIIDANAGFERLTGYAAPDIVGRPLTIVVPPGQREAARARFEELLAGPARSYEAVTYSKDGRGISVRVDATPIRVAGRVEGLFYTSYDLSGEHALRRQVDEFDERLATLLQVAGSSWSGGAQVDEALFLASNALHMSHGYVVEIRGGDLAVVHRHGSDDLLPVDHRMPVTQSIGGRLASSERAVAVDDLTIEPYASELRERDLPWGSYIGSRLEVDGSPYGALLFLDKARREDPFKQSDIDFIDVLSSMVTTAIARELHGKRLHERATHDELTGLANRAALEEHFGRAAARARRSREAIGVHYIDLDGFKPVNDAYGHAFGDEVLVEIARRFARAVRGHDVVSRIGGDEFVIMQTAVADTRDVRMLTERVLGFLDEPIALSNGTSVTVGASIGIGLFPEDGEDLQRLLQVADAAMYREKQLRREEA
ncbi:MAG TPA: diguanylate cyclase [Candidatus Baltobacteraceae bacterium]|jgi:diguanylate cyclase (GGDEF)-like protein/PAS domain S-box-containing protein|nr:diguanylate cyclase [Candidatus Baltobacteraceae bacterium]